VGGDLAVKYRAGNGIVTRELTEAEAREHYDRAEFVSGEFGGRFVTCPVGEYGRLLVVAATTYTPIHEPPPETAVRQPSDSDPSVEAGE
jgi:hypothetical protein